jgi:branched-chain amino acid transport system ATP-binding protein
MSLLALDNVQVRMGSQPILRGISLVVPAGGIVAVLGRNGVGKTTMMRAISGVYRCAGGAITFAGEPIANLPSHTIFARGVCQAPEGRQLFSDMTVAENLRAGALHLRDARFAAEAERIYALFPVLAERRSQRAGSLSGGEQQMLCIGRALMGEPKILLLDEPSLGLAPLVVRRILELVQEIRRAGTAILLVEQNARAALAVADRAYIMEGGRIALEGAAAALMDDPRVQAAYLGGAVEQS